MKVASVDEIINLDKAAEEKFGISQEILMENAGNAVFHVIENEIGVREKRFVIFAGPGNNGGDGFVAARKLSSTGAKVSLFFIGDKNKLKGAAKKNYLRLNGFPVEQYNIEFFDRIVEASIEKSDAIIDAIFGTGLSGKISGIHKEIIQGINLSNKTIISADIPSGINGDTGEVMGIAVKADYTVTFGLPKRGHFLYPGAEHTGKLYVSRISYPPSLYENPDINVQLNTPVELTTRKKDTHKGNYGKALFIAGGKNYLGAPVFCSYAFLKSGGGLSYLATPKSIAPFIAMKAGEVVIIPAEETKEQSISMQNLDNLLKLSEQMDIVAIGSGITLEKETKEFVKEFVKQVGRPVIIDGDGLTAVSEEIKILKKRKEGTIITPHMGEFAKITGREINEIKKNRIKILQESAQELNATIILKGAFTLTGTKNGKIFINLSGNPGMATAGSGDVLTGTIAAMYGLGLSIEIAARTGVFIHGIAGDLKAKEKGIDGMTATDILEGLPDAIKYYKENYERIKETNYERIYII